MVPRTGLCAIIRYVMKRVDFKSGCLRSRSAPGAIAAVWG
ncbi:hypothetical protein GSU3550 [Geobacter sulfurreducens PCA]|uniref:Uncharacterized protein n=1 Tax=Geobacter sulfurreducens (strain ATCC 51573 / DSM 12127 / PCA) TaxID=243231 RepID=I7EP78_GEOSL|nr:hypothetical protein KN400_3464 [Geobacter sulfurreducens KN400]AFP20450.1 hypothetical protein GSU3550 [Geobacter sulfurreducens PCA]AJY68318.1 hypothetical protein RW64_01240 [Geobacter sulfurreducens]HBB68594.1 hypothetical protein [Geobacter sulfurreducens]HCD97627.1 hypothetical protein [Geobacter sulfurreducens]